MGSKGAWLLFTMLPLMLSAQQNDSTVHRTIDRNKLRTVLIAGSVGYAVGVVALSELWYKDTPRQPFSFFNDNAEWKQVDKLGHFYSAFYLSYGAAKGYRWCGLKDSKANLWGALTGFFVLVPIEVLDGFSEAYGASAGDLLADAGGALFFYGQSYQWKEIRIYPKFSFSRTHFPTIRPDLLGDNLVSEILKDYNGQTYWLSFDMDRFMKFPRWLNIAVGYGASGMVYARESENQAAGYDAYRQYYVSLDLDPSAIHTNSKALRTLLFIAGMIKLPSPAIEFSRKGTQFHFLY